jgi:dimethylglycine dehydrogenase
VALADLSAFSKVEVNGPDATAFMEGLGANRPPRRLGGVGLTHVLATGGGVLSEFTVTRTGEDRYYLVSAAAAERWDLDLLRTRAAPFAKLAIDDVKAAQGVLAVMGPRARELLAGLSDNDLGNEAFPWLTAREITVAGVPVLALRVSYVGELGWELHHPLDRQADLLAALMEAGRRFEAGLFGAFAMNAMRLEKGYRAWGADLTSERTPLEAGLDFLVKCEGRDFVRRCPRSLRQPYRAAGRTTRRHGDLGRLWAPGRPGPGASLLYRGSRSRRWGPLGPGSWGNSESRGTDPPALRPGQPAPPGQRLNTRPGPVNQRLGVRA